MAFPAGVVTGYRVRRHVDGKPGDLTMGQHGRHVCVQCALEHPVGGSVVVVGTVRRVELHVDPVGQVTGRWVDGYSAVRRCVRSRSPRRRMRQLGSGWRASFVRKSIMSMSMRRTSAMGTSSSSHWL